MRHSENYRGWRRNEAKRLKLLWRKLPREIIERTNGRTTVKTGQVVVVLP